MQQPRQSLIASLGEALAARDAQQLRLEEMQKKTDSTQNRFLSRLQSVQSGNTENLAADRRQAMEEIRKNFSPSAAMADIQTSARLNVRWEQAFCDCFEALMRLYAFPEARPAAEKIMDTVRAIRLLQIEDGEREVPQFNTPPIPPELGTDAEGSAERKRQMAGMALNWFNGIDGYVEKRRQTHEEKSERTHQLLLEALSEAKTLLV